MNQSPATLYAAHLDRLRERHDEALAHAGFESLIVYAGMPRYHFLDDRPYTFDANPHFKAWVPLPAHAGGLVIYRPGRRPRLIYHQPSDYWHKPPADPAGFWTTHFDIDVVRAPTEARRMIADLGGRTAFLGEPDEHLFPAQAVDLNPSGLLNELHYARAIKTDYEVACLRAANERALRAHAVAAEAFREGASEFAIHLRYCAAAAQRESELPYDNIVALGRNAAVLHYTDYEHTAPAEPTSFLIDAGAKNNGYCADVTRTYAAHPGLFADLIVAVDAAQQRICAQACDGADFVALNFRAHEEIAAILSETGIVNASTEAIVASGISRVFLPHGLGHYLGLQVHDVGGHLAGPTGGQRPPPHDHPFLRLTRTLRAGAVCTIEPGLYFIDSLLAGLKGSGNAALVDWRKIDALRPYGGIRIEDDVHVLPDGVQNLTRECEAPR